MKRDPENERLKAEWLATNQPTMCPMGKAYGLSEEISHMAQLSGPTGLFAADPRQLQRIEAANLRLTREHKEAAFDRRARAARARRKRFT